MSVSSSSRCTGAILIWALAAAALVLSTAAANSAACVVNPSQCDDLLDATYSQAGGYDSRSCSYSDFANTPSDGTAGAEGMQVFVTSVATRSPVAIFDCTILCCSRRRPCLA